MPRPILSSYKVDRRISSNYPGSCESLPSWSRCSDSDWIGLHLSWGVITRRILSISHQITPLPEELAPCLPFLYFSPTGDKHQWGSDTESVERAILEASESGRDCGVKLSTSLLSLLSQAAGCIHGSARLRRTEVESDWFSTALAEGVTFPEGLVSRTCSNISKALSLSSLSKAFHRPSQAPSGI